MNESSAGRSGFPPAYLDRVGSSFTDFLGVTAPDLLPGRRPVPQIPMGDIAPHGTTIVVRHLRRRRPHGRRPSRHHGQPDLLARHREGLPGRRLQRDRHRRCRGHRDRDGPALPGGTRALREDRGHHALPRRQGQPAGRDDPRQPRRRHAGPGRRPAVRRLRPRRRTRHEPGPDLQLRRHRRELRGARLRRGRLRLAVRQELAQEDLAQRPARPTPPPAPSSRPSTTPRTTTPRPAAPTRSAGSTRSSTASTPRAPSG